MEEHKVYLFVETPFSFKKPKGFLILPMLFSLVVYIAMIALFWLKMPEKAQIITVVCSFAFLLSSVGIAIFRLSYVTLEDQYLVCKYGGLLPKRILISNRLRWKIVGGQLQVLGGDAVRLQMPDSNAAKRLMSAARIPAIQQNSL